MTTAKQTSADEWNTISEGMRTRISFDTPGDTFIGVYQGKEEIEYGVQEDGSPNRWTDYHFSCVDASGVDAGEQCSIAESAMLTKAMEKIGEGELVKIAFTREVPCADKKKSPAKDFKVYTKKA